MFTRSSPASNNLKIAIVEDDPFMLEGWLSELPNNHVETFSSPEALLFGTPIVRFDLFIIDFFFDGSALNGADLAVRIQLAKKRGAILALASDFCPSRDDQIVFDVLIAKLPCPLDNLRQRVFVGTSDVF